MAKKTRGFDPEIADEIVNRMIGGKDIVAVSKDEDMPGRRTIYDWMEAHPDFRARCARAREALADHHANQILEIAEKCTAETAQADRVKLSALQWLAEKRAPKTYGQKVEVEANVETTHAPSEALVAFMAVLEANKGG